MLYRHLALATAVSALAACASTGSGTTDEPLATTSTTATDTTTAVTPPSPTPSTTDSLGQQTTVDSASARSTTGMAAGGDAQAAAQIDTMIAVAERGLTTAPTEAVNAITGFQSYVSTAGSPALSELNADLDALKAELQKPTVDNQAVNAVLGRLGPKVTAAASSAGAHSEHLTRLGQALTKAGSGM